jgi:deoxyadenosine/deoxycytidine kinase
MYAAFAGGAIPVNIYFTSTRFVGNLKRLQRKRLQVADTTKIEDKLERKKVKRIARKKAAPKAKRTGARGENKKKLKKAARGVSKR